MTTTDPLPPFSLSSQPRALRCGFLLLASTPQPASSDVSASKLAIASSGIWASPDWPIALLCGMWVSVVCRGCGTRGVCCCGRVANIDGRLCGNCHAVRGLCKTGSPERSGLPLLSSTAPKCTGGVGFGWRCRALPFRLGHAQACGGRGVGRNRDRGGVGARGQGQGHG